MRPTLENAEAYNLSVLAKLLIKSKEVRSGAGAASLEAILHFWTSTGVGQVVTLADGTHDGQLAIFFHTTDGGSLVITPATWSGAASTTLTMVDSGDCCAFIWQEGAWWLLWSTANTEGTPLVIA